MNATLPLNPKHLLSASKLRELRRRKASEAMGRLAPLFIIGTIATVTASVVVPVVGFSAAGFLCALFLGLRGHYARRPNPELEARFVADYQASCQAERNQRQDANLLRTAHQLRYDGRRDQADILLNVLRLKRRLEARLGRRGPSNDQDIDHEPFEADMDELISRVADGVADHLEQLARVERELPGALLAAHEERFASLEIRRSEHLGQIREAYAVLLETADVLRVPHRLPVVPPPLPRSLPGSRQRSPRRGPTLPSITEPIGRAIDELRAENRVARRVRDFLEHDLHIDDEHEFLDEDSALLREL